MFFFIFLLSFYILNLNHTYWFSTISCFYLTCIYLINKDLVVAAAAVFFFTFHISSHYNNFPFRLR